VALVSHKRAVGSSTEAASMSESISGSDRWEFWTNRGGCFTWYFSSLEVIFYFENVFVNVWT
jgi:hypothetical protein